MSPAATVRYLRPHRLSFCVEGGGTHSRAALFSERSPEPLAFARAGACNPSTSFDLASEAVSLLWEKVKESADKRESEIRMVIGSAGLVPLPVRRRVIDHFSFFGEVHVLSDGYASLVGAGGGKPCGMVVAGTGCAGHRLRPDGTSLQRDGWGWIGGDRGSGFWIGHQAVRQALAARDGVCRPSLLSDRINAELGEDDHEVSARLASPLPRDVAALAKIVFECAEQGDGFAEKLLEDAAGHLRDLFAALGCDRDEPLYVAGTVAEALRDRIAEGMAPQPSLPSGRALEGCRCVSDGLAPLEWA